METEHKLLQFFWQLITRNPIKITSNKSQHIVIKGTIEQQNLCNCGLGRPSPPVTRQVVSPGVTRILLGGGQQVCQKCGTHCTDLYKAPSVLCSPLDCSSPSWKDATVAAKQPPGPSKFSGPPAGSLACRCSLDLAHPKQLSFKQSVPSHCPPQDSSPALTDLPETSVFPKPTTELEALPVLVPRVELPLSSPALTSLWMSLCSTPTPIRKQPGCFFTKSL